MTLELTHKELEIILNALVYSSMIRGADAEIAKSLIHRLGVHVNREKT